jgi:stage V sporulation protein S
MDESRIIKVKATSPVAQTASCVVERIKEGEECELRAIGASAVNQMYKALAVARGKIAVTGKDLFVRPGFHESKNPDGTAVTAMVAKVTVM